MTNEEMKTLYEYLYQEETKAQYRRQLAIDTGDLSLYDYRFLKAMELINFLIKEKL